MATNEILQFAETDTGTNLLTQAEYLADAQRPIGNQPGVARSKLVNKALRQASLIAAGLAEYIADNQANNVTDALTPQNIADYLQAALTGALGVTPPQFDNDTSLATTAFVQRALGNLQGVLNITTTPVTLTAADCGKCLDIYNSASVVNLPDSSTVPVGASFPFYTANDITLNSYGGQSIVPYPGAVGTVTSQILPKRSFGKITYNGGAWEIEIGGAGTSHSISAGSRPPNTTFTNTTGRIMFVMAQWSMSSQAFHAYLTVAGTRSIGDYRDAASSGYGVRVFTAVLPGETYSWTWNPSLNAAQPTLGQWFEIY